MQYLSLLLFFLRNVIIVLNFAVFARIILSWFVPAGSMMSSRIYRVLCDVTDPFFVVARLLPHRFGMLDISAIYVFILLNILQYFIESMLATLIV